jgi:hypothetical protein
MKLRSLGAMAFVFAGTGWALAQSAPAPAGAVPSGPPAAVAGPAAPPAVAGPAAPPAGPVGPGSPAPLGVYSPSALAAPGPNGPGGPPAGCADGNGDNGNGNGYGNGFNGNGGPQGYFDAEYLLWRVRRSHFPTATAVLPVGLIAVNTTDLFVTSPTGPAVPGTPTVGLVPVFITSTADFGGGSNSGLGDQSGVRLTGGWWLDPDECCGVETRWFWLNRRSDDRAVTSGSTGANPFVINTGLSQNVFLLSTVDGTTMATLLQSNPILVTREATASVFANTSTELWGAEANVRSTWLWFGPLKVGGLTGFRYLNFRENLTVDSSTQLVRPADVRLLTPADLSGAFPPVVGVTTFDSIRTHNNFYGGQIGLEAELWCDCFFLAARATAALGGVHESVDVAGSTQVTGGTTPVTTAGGLLSGPLDVGSHHRNRVAWVDELNLKVGYQFTSWLRTHVGYDALLLTRVARPAEQSTVNTLNTTIEVNGQATNVAVSQPAISQRDSRVWIQGINFGVELLW